MVFCAFAVMLLHDTIIIIIIIYYTLQATIWVIPDHVVADGDQLNSRAD